MNTAGRIRILSIDDHPMVREGLAGIINRQPDMRIVAEAATGKLGIEQHRIHRPDLTLLDLRLPDMSGMDVMKTALIEKPDARFVVLSSYEGDTDIKRALHAGAQGYLLKGVEGSELMDEIRRVHSGIRQIAPNVAARMVMHFGGDALSPREVEVLEQVAAGKRNKEIAYRLMIAEDTVNTHIKKVLQKLGASDRTHAVMIALRRGIIHL